MIKSSDKENNNVYRILKVLTNKDYLAIDTFMNYYILAPIDTKIHQNRTGISNLKTKVQHNFSSNIIQTKQMIQIDGIVYSVFYVGKQQAYWVKSIEQIKIHNPTLLFNLFDESIRLILKFLLLWKLKQVKYYLDAKNFVIIKGSIYLLLLPRGKINHFSIKKNQKNHSKSPQNTDSGSLSHLLNNQLQIIRQFACILMQIFGSTPSDNNSIPSNQFVWTLLKQMIKKEVTYEYLQIKLSEYKQKRKTSPFKIFKKIITESIVIDAKKRLRSLDFQNYHKVDTQSLSYNLNTPKTHKNYNNRNSIIKKRVFTTQTNYSQQKSRQHNRSQKSKMVLLQQQVGQVRLSQRQSIWKNRIQKNNKEKQRYKQWLNNHKFQLSFKERVKRQGEIARQKFRSSVQSKQQDHQSNKISDENKLRNRLMKKLIRFKTQYRPEQNIIPKLNYKISQSQDKQKQLPNIQIQRKLEFSENKQRNKSPYNKLNLMPQIVQMTLSQRTIIRIDQNDKKIIQKPHIPPVIQQPIIKYQSFYQPSQIQKLPFQQINEATVIPFNKISKSNVKVQDINHFCKERSNQIYNQKNATQNSINNNITNTQQKNDTIDLNKNNAIKFGQNIIKHQTIQQKVQLIAVDNKNNQKISQKAKIKKQSLNLNDDDEIQQINFSKPSQKAIPESKKQIDNNYFKEVNTQPSIQPNLQKIKSPIIQPNYDLLAQSIQEYITMINILGNICVKSVKQKDKLAGLDWRKGMYFIYQRFCYQRQRIVKSLNIGASQVYRKIRKIKYQQWQRWFYSDQKNKKLKKLADQNVKIRRDLNKFADKILQTSKLDRKINYYIRNRQKILETEQNKTRMLLSQFAVSTFIQLYQFVSEKQINAEQVINYVQDCLFGLRIIGQLDNITPQNLWVNVDDYQQYNDFGEINKIAEQIYIKYYEDQMIKGE